MKRQIIKKVTEHRWHKDDPTIKLRPCLRCDKMVKQPIQYRLCPVCTLVLFKVDDENDATWGDDSYGELVKLDRKSPKYGTSGG